MAESFFSSLKKERIKKRIYTSREMATTEIYDYIELFYNRTRRHSHLSGVSPEAFEAVSKQAYLCPQEPGKTSVRLFSEDRSTIELMTSSGPMALDRLWRGFSEK